MLLAMGVIAVTCRGVGFDRLGVILENGCDVSPTHSPIFADDIEKAIEYGGGAQVVQVFDNERLQRTFTEVSADTDPSEIQKLKDTYQSWEISLDGKKIWFSMLPFEDGRRATPYEVAYGWFIPDNPLDALIAVAIFVGTDRERDTALRLLDNWLDPEPTSIGMILPIQTRNRVEVVGTAPSTWRASPRLREQIGVSSRVG
jgi:hypothetical protein